MTKELDHNRSYLEAMHASHQHLRKEYRKLHALADLHDDDVRRSTHASQRLASRATQRRHERRALHAARCACVPNAARCGEWVCLARRQRRGLRAALGGMQHARA